MDAGNSTYIPVGLLLFGGAIFIASFNSITALTKTKKMATPWDRFGEFAKSKHNLDADVAFGMFVDTFHDKVIADPGLEKFFVGVDQAKLKKHQYNFLKYALTGGTHSYSGRSMEKAHARLFKMGLDQNHFDMVAGHVVDTMNGLEVPQAIQDEIVGLVAPLRQLFVDGAIAARASQE